jgi:hypothetical protein
VFFHSSSPALAKQIDRFDYKKLDRSAEILKQCFKGTPNTDLQQGCIDSLQQLHEHCIEQRQAFFVGVKRTMHEIFMDAKYCPLVDNSFGYVTLNRYFNHDEQHCIKGYETVANKLSSFYKNSGMLRLEEPFAYDFEKASCKDFKKYVHFCDYVDGDLKNNKTVSYQYLPPLERYLEKKFCPPNLAPDDPGYGVSKIDNLLKANVTTNNPDTYLKAIQELRENQKRNIANTKEAETDYCKNIRGSYSNLGCQKWEKVTDEESIYYDLDDFRSRRIKKKPGGTSN